MRKLLDRMNLSFIKAKNAMNNFMNDENGDTNFISIAIILVVVIVIAVVFIGLSQDLGAALKLKIEELKTKMGI